MKLDLKKYMNLKTVLHWAAVSAVAIAAMHYTSADLVGVVTANILPVTAAVAAADIVLENFLKL